MAKLTPEERQKKVDKKQKRKEYKLMKEQEMFEECLEHQGRGWMQPEEEIYLRKLIRKDIREMIKMERMAEYKGETTDSEFDSGEENMDRRIEDKVMFGSDSDKDIDEYVLSKLKGQIERGEVKFIDNENEEEYDEEYDEEGEDEQTEQQKTDGQESSESELQFEQMGEKVSLPSKRSNQVNDSGSDSQD